MAYIFLFKNRNTAKFTLHGPDSAIEQMLPHINQMLSDCSLDPNVKEPCQFKLTKPEIWTLNHHVTGDYTNLVSCRMANLMYAHGYILDKHSYQTTEELFVFFKDINKTN
jgi:hypothetical protein